MSKQQFNPSPGGRTARCNHAERITRYASRITSLAWRAGAGISVFMAVLLLAFASKAQQPQTPSAATVQSNGTHYNWVPYTGEEPGLENQWSAENVGTPALTAAPSDTRRGNAGLSDENSDAVLAGGDMFVLAIDKPGDVLQPVQMHCADNPGTAEYVSNYQGVNLWRINPATGAIRSGYPKRLDAHEGVCSLPHLVVTNSGNVMAVWKESGGGGGYDQICARYITVGTDGLSVVYTVAGSWAYHNIRELSVASSKGGVDDAAVIFRDNIGPNHDQIWGQRFDYAGATYWNGGAPLEIDNAAVNSGKWNPVISWNEIRGQFDMAWGDNVYLIQIPPTGPAVIMVQAVTLTGSALVYGSGPTSITGPTLDDPAGGAPCEFYMCSPAGFTNGGPSDLGITMFFYRDGATDLRCTGALLNGMGAATIYNRDLNATIPTGYPCSMTKRTVSTSPPKEDLVIVYDNTFTALPGCPGAGPGVGIWADYVDLSVVAGALPASYSGGATNSVLFRSVTGINPYGMWVAVPDIGQIDGYGISFSPFAFMAACFNPLQQLAVRNGGTDTYFSGVASAGNFPIFYYQSGLANPAPYPWSHDYANLLDPETNDPRRLDMPGATYDVASYATGSVFPFLANGPAQAGIEDQTWDIDPNTAVLDGASATVYSEITVNTGYSDIVLGSGTNHWKITNANGANGSYYQPKCAIYYDAGSGHYMALVTYIHELYVGASQFEDVTVDLTNGTVTADPLGAIDGPAANETYRNWAIVADNSATPTNFVCVYGGDYGVAGTNDEGSVRSVGYGGAARIWGPNTIRAYVSGSSIDQVRACYNPDPTNSGAYVIWRETPHPVPSGLNAGFGLELVNSALGPAIYGGLTAYGNPNSRENACITAGANPPGNPGPPYWAFMAWEDEGIGTIQPMRIYADAFTNTCAYWPGASNLNGVLISGGAPYEAHHPDAIPNPENTAWPMVAYDQDATSTNGVKAITIQNLNLALVPPYNGTLVLASPDPTPALPDDGACSWTMDDAKWSLLGFMQRRPKLVALDADSSAFPYDRSGTYANLNHWVMCVYEAEAYNLYDPGNLGPGGVAPSYGLSGNYLNMWLAEYNRSGAPISGYLQNNIVARVVNPNLSAGVSPTEPLIGGKVAVFANTNAQDLVGVTYSLELGPIATCLDYVNTAQTNAIVRTNRIIPCYYAQPGIFGALLNGTWPAPALGSYTTAPLPTPEYLNTSWFPLVLYPAVGSPDVPTVPPGPYVWFVDPAVSPTGSPSITLNPEWPEPAPVMIDYYGNKSNENRLLATAHVEANGLGAWPLSLPDSWGNMGIGAPVNQGVGFKHSTHGASSASDALSVSLDDNPVSSSETATISGIPGRTAYVRILDVLGQTVQKSDPVTISARGATLSFDVAKWPAGTYIIEAIGDEGSHANAMLTVSH